jgi:hypothetical protein
MGEKEKAALVEQLRESLQREPTAAETAWIDDLAEAPPIPRAGTDEAVAVFIPTVGKDKPESA